ncbi:MAG: hypothetical protein QW775_04345 [Ignisphaera sp.]|uniref:Uncharacterized protein n=1 Tax=Ignisphaera aggregans TaxID=334771 RepID=A0A7C4JII0_9CREN
MSNQYKLSPEELRVYEIIKRETKNSKGIKQTVLRKHPELKDIGSKKITEIIRKLIKLNLVERVLVNDGGKNSYILVTKEIMQDQYDTLEEDTLVTAINSVISKKVDIFMLLTDIPCIKCRHIFECSIGRAHDPLHCSLITYFILEKSGVISKTRRT